MTSPANARDSRPPLVCKKSPVSAGDQWRALRLAAGKSHVVADSRCKSKASGLRLPAIGGPLIGPGRSGPS